MTREEILIRLLLCVIVMSIYTYFVKWKSYEKGFLDGVKHYSDIVNKVLHDTNQFNKKAEEAEMDIAAYIESIRPLNETESEGKE